MYIHGQRKMISIRIRPEEGHSSGIFYINLPTTIAFRYHKYLFEKKMATVWLKEKTKLLILKEINKIAAKYGDPLIDTSEILLISLSISSFVFSFNQTVAIFFSNKYL